MKGRIGKLRWLCLFILSLFLMEYLEPSTVGVRADLDPPMKQERKDSKGPQSSEDGSAATPHAMLFAGPSSPETRIIVRSFRTETLLQPPQCVSPTIYRPPLTAR
jgi:hypothetical protein